MTKPTAAPLVASLLLGLAGTGAWADEWDDARATASAIDRLIGDAQQRAGLAPSPLADDAEFVRRASLDLTGRIPSAQVAERFINSPVPDKRRLLIGWLMETPEYREGWSTVWTLWLLGRERDEVRVDRLAFRQWVRDEVIAPNMPHDEFVRELITATGRSDQSGATNYLLQFGRTPADATGMISRNFLGRQIQCAQCHDHMTEPFTQAQFWGMVAFLERTRNRPIRGEDGRPEATQLFDVRRGPPTQVQDTDRVVQPTFVDGTVYARESSVNLREALADELANPDSPALARATVNRLWAHFTGHGFVEPIDDFRDSNPANLPEVLDFLAQDFRGHGFDREHLIRSIALSQAYQRSSIATPDNASDETLYTHARLRPMTPEQLFWSLAVATGVDPTQEGPRPGAAAMQMPGGEGRALTPEQRLERMVTQFVFNFSDDEKDETTMFEGTIPLSLFRMNSPLLSRAVSVRRGGTLAQIARTQSDSAAQVSAVYMAALSRPPTDDERAEALGHLNMPRIGNRPQQTRLEDLMWALLNSSEFLFNH